MTPSEAYRAIRAAIDAQVSDPATRTELHAHLARAGIALAAAPRRAPRIPGFDRIGRVDSVGRRSLWMRASGDPAVIELRAGREGDDAKASITPANPAYRDLVDVLSAAWFAAEWEDPDGRGLEAEREEPR